MSTELPAGDGGGSIPRRDTMVAEEAQMRDVPSSCICWWDWKPQHGSWARIRPIAGCPWHEDAS